VLGVNPLWWLLDGIVFQRIEGVLIVVFWVLVTPTSLLLIGWWTSTTPSPFRRRFDGRQQQRSIQGT